MSSTTLYIAKHPLLARYQWLVSAFLLGYLIFPLVACSSGADTTVAATPTPTSTSSPTAIPLPTGTLLYQANWSHGLADWHASPGAKIVGGSLQSDANADFSMTVPYRPTVPDYAVEFRLQIVSVLHDGGSFLLTADQAPGRDGYSVGIISLLAPGPHQFSVHPNVQAYIEPVDPSGSDGFQAHDYEPGFQWRSYRIEIHGGRVDFFIDNSSSARIVSGQTSMLSNGPLRLHLQMAVLRVSDFRIIAA